MLSMVFRLIYKHVTLELPSKKKEEEYMHETTKMKFQLLLARPWKLLKPRRCKSGPWTKIEWEYHVYKQVQTNGNTNDKN